LLDHLHDLVRIERYGFLKPWHHRAKDRALFAFTRTSVARGVAIGFFFGILTPVAQIVFSVLAAIAFRANVLVAGASTLITNPFVMPFVYYAAYRTGLVITGRGADRITRAEEAAALNDVAESEEAASQALDVGDWFPTLLDWAVSVGPPLIIGVVTLAVALAAAGYAIVYVAWGLLARWRAAAGES
jgi:uncharacterized protein (DUF2062 family)